MNKDELEKMWRKSGGAPVSREQVGDYDLYFADGFSNAPHLSFQYKFGIEPGEFPLGMFVTLWWLGKGEKLHVGRPLFFEPDQTNKDARINAARDDAMRALQKLKLRTH